MRCCCWGQSGSGRSGRNCDGRRRRCECWRRHQRLLVLRDRHRSHRWRRWRRMLVDYIAMCIFGWQVKNITTNLFTSEIASWRSIMRVMRAFCATKQQKQTITMQRRRKIFTNFFTSWRCRSVEWNATGRMRFFASFLVLNNNSKVNSHKKIWISNTCWPYLIDYKEKIKWDIYFWMCVFFTSRCEILRRCEKCRKVMMLHRLIAHRRFECCIYATDEISFKNKHNFFKHTCIVNIVVGLLYCITTIQKQ